MPSNTSDRPRLVDDPEQPGVIAARCHHLADQLAGGPVRDALLEMARDYSGRALDAARTAPFRLELERSQRDATALGLFAAFDRFIDGIRGAAIQGAAIHGSAPRLPLAPVAVQQTAPAPAVTPRRASRLYRIHALQAR
jgi:hypothetical protein